MTKGNKAATNYVTAMKDVTSNTRIVEFAPNSKRGFSAKRYDLYKPNMTVGAYCQAVKDWAAKTTFDEKDDKRNAQRQKAQAGYGMPDIKYDLAHEYIKLAND